uniref:Uncharacterized protein n=1 Tax=Aegilops tauschii subsp. strangulata TaxID=200361 RepID=A0A453PJ74_AEGTS
WSEALHGVAWSKGMHLDGPLRAATSFPQVILTAASFNPHLWYRIGQVCTHERRRLLPRHSAFEIVCRSFAPFDNDADDQRPGLRLRAFRPNLRSQARGIE